MNVQMEPELLLGLLLANKIMDARMAPFGIMQLKHVNHVLLASHLRAELVWRALLVLSQPALQLPPLGVHYALLEPSNPILVKVPAYHALQALSLLHLVKVLVHHVMLEVFLLNSVQARVLLVLLDSIIRIRGQLLARLVKLALTSLNLLGPPVLLVRLVQAREWVLLHARLFKIHVQWEVSLPTGMHLASLVLPALSHLALGHHPVPLVLWAFMQQIVQLVCLVL